jgi:hypothetical protein
MTLYVVDDGKRKRLIHAKTRAGARSFAAKDTIKVVKAEPYEAHQLAVAGVKMETALEDEPS